MIQESGSGIENAWRLLTAWHKVSSGMIDGTYTLAAILWRITFEREHYSWDNG